MSGDLLMASCACGHKFAVAAKHQGKRVRCPSCKEAVPVPFRARCRCGKQLRVKSDPPKIQITCPGCGAKLRAHRVPESVRVAFQAAKEQKAPEKLLDAVKAIAGIDFHRHFDVDYGKQESAASLLHWQFVSHVSREVNSVIPAVMAIVADHPVRDVRCEVLRSVIKGGKVLEAARPRLFEQLRAALVRRKEKPGRDGWPHLLYQAIVAVAPEYRSLGMTGAQSRQLEESFQDESLQKVRAMAKESFFRDWLDRGESNPVEEAYDLVPPRSHPASQTNGLSRCRYWVCTGCSAVYEKEELEIKLTLFTSATFILGSRSCVKCGETHSCSSIFRGQYDLPREYWPRIERQFGKAVNV